MAMIQLRMRRKAVVLLMHADLDPCKRGKCDFVVLPWPQFGCKEFFLRGLPDSFPAQSVLGLNLICKFGLG